MFHSFELLFSMRAVGMSRLLGSAVLRKPCVFWVTFRGMIVYCFELSGFRRRRLESIIQPRVKPKPEEKLCRKPSSPAALSGPGVGMVA